MWRGLVRTLIAGAILSGTFAASHFPAREARATATPRCHTGGLYIALIPHSGQGATGHLDVVFSVKSLTQQPCYLYGYPGIQLINSGGKNIVTHVQWGTGFFFINRPKEYVVLKTGQVAYFDVGWTHFPTPGQSCPDTRYLLVTPPDEHTPIAVAATLKQICGGIVSASPISTSNAP